MSCNRCAASSSSAAAAAGAPDIEASWSANREHPQYCPTCHAFLRRDGGCTRCEGTEFAWNVNYLLTHCTGNATLEDEWEPNDDPSAVAICIAAVQSGKELTWKTEDSSSMVERSLNYNPATSQYEVESFFYELAGQRRPGGYYAPPEEPTWEFTDQYQATFDTYEDAYKALQGRPGRRQAGAGQPDHFYFEANLERVKPAWLTGFVESPGFNRADGQRILEAIRQNAVNKLAHRHYHSTAEIDQAVAAINANTLRHSAQVMVMATKIARLTGADPQTTRLAGLAAGYHDSGKDSTNFVYHHLDSADFAQKSLWDSGLARAGGKTTAEAAAEVAAVRQAIMEHMPFGDGRDPGNFMNRALAAEAAGIIKVDGAGYRKRLRYLMGKALQQPEAAISRVEKWVEANGFRYETKDALGEALRQEFGGRELSYPTPTSEAARILHTAAAGEHLAETVRGGDGRSLLESGYSASDITWAADGLTLSSAESLEKIVAIHQVQWGRAGTEPLVVSMSSLTGGGFGNPGTAVDAANSMTIPAARASAEQEIRLMREFMTDW